MYRVLSVDGGGMKGTFAAAFLAELESHLGDNIGRYFDLAVGTSTGGIIALALGSGHSATQILSFYKSRGPAVFTQTKRLPIQVFGPKYDMNRLGQELENVLGDKRLADSTIRLAIPTYQVNTGHSFIYRTPHHPDPEAHNHNARLVDVALATAALPIYFRPFTSEDGKVFVDGGLYAVNPVALGVVEAIGTLGWPAKKVRVLSLGPTRSEVSADLTEELNRGLASFYRKPYIYVDMIMRAQSSFSEQVARTLLPGPGQVIRVNPLVGDKPYSLDTLDGLDRLEELGREEARRLWPMLKPLFKKPAKPFVPQVPKAGG